MRALFALFIRSVREDTRSRLPTILRAALVLIILLIVWANQRDFTNRPAPGREFLLIVVMVNLAFVAVAALGSFASAITEEKEDETLPLLRMTDLSPLAILFGKSTTRLLGAALLLAVQIPFTVIAVTLGGVSIDQVLGAYAILGATTFFLCNLALLGSVICRTTIRAGTFTGIVGGVLFVLLPFIAVETALRRMRPGALSPQTAWEYFATSVMEANPVYSLAMLIEMRGGGMVVHKQVWPTLGAGAFCFLLSWMLFDRFCAAPAEALGRRDRWKFASLFRGNGWRRRPSPRRVLAWKDFHFLIGGWRGMLIRFALCGLVFVGCYTFEQWDSPQSTWRSKDIGEETMVFAAMGFGLELGLLATRIFGVERRSLTLAGLVGLPKTTTWLIRQKLLGCLPALLPSVGLFGVGVFLYANWHLTNPGFSWTWDEDETIATIYFLSQGLLLAVLTAYLSLRIRRGALPVGIAVLTAWNIFTVIVADSFRAADEEWAFLGFGIGSLVIAVFISILIPSRIRAAAAEG